MVVWLKAWKRGQRLKDGCTIFFIKKNMGVFFSLFTHTVDHNGQIIIKLGEVLLWYVLVYLTSLYCMECTSKDFSFQCLTGRQVKMQLNRPRAIPNNPYEREVPCNSSTSACKCRRDFFFSSQNAMGFFFFKMQWFFFFPA